jgi:hypothetical protein
MLKAPPSLLVAVAVLGLLAGCGSTPAGAPQAPGKDPGKEKEAALKRAALERDLPIAREKLAKARRDLADQELSGRAAVIKAKADLDLASARLKDVDEKETPNRLAQARLGLKRARDMLEDSKEELEQLELMYKDQDLADKTREIVIRRAKRGLERAQEGLKLEEESVKTLEERTIPHERGKLALEAADKLRALESAERGAESSLAEKKIGLLGATAEVARLEAELAAIEKDSKESR